MAYPLIIVIALCWTLCFDATFGRKEFHQRLAKANNEVALKLLPLVGSKGGNFVYSPLGLSTALKMVHRGAKGETAKELTDVLGYDEKGISDEEQQTTLKKFLENQRAGGLRMCNSILVQKTLGITPKYQKSMKTIYEAMCEAVDFKNEGPKVVKKVNSWVSEKTGGKIDGFLEDVDRKTRLLLLSAVSFNASFEKPFSPNQTKLMTFNGQGSRCKDNKTPMMRERHWTKYVETDNCKAIELHFLNSNYSLMIYLPNDKDGLPELEKSLTLDSLQKLRQDMQYKTVDILLPKFKVDFKRDMRDGISRLGAKKVFSDGADLARMVTQPAKVSHVVHNAVIEVCEAGAETAEGSGSVLQPSAHYLWQLVHLPHLRSKTFHADHPFLFSIIDRSTDMIVLMGQVSECDPKW